MNTNQASLKQNEIEQTMNQLASAVSDIEKLARQLPIRFSVCLRPCELTDSGKPTQAYNSEMARIIHTSVLNIKSVYEILADMLQRCELPQSHEAPCQSEGLGSIAGIPERMIRR